MRKIILLLVISLVVFSGVVAAQAEGEWLFKAGYDFSGEVEVTPEDGDKETDDVESGYAITGEYIFSSESEWKLGAGLTYQLERDVEPAEGNNVPIRYTPIYGLAEYRLQESPVYFVGHLGYNLFDADDPNIDNTSGGMYYALGGGMEFEDKYQLEMLYTVHNSSAEFEGDEIVEIDFEYTKLTLNFGIKF